LPSKKRICVLRHGYYPEDVRVFKEVRALCEAGYSVDVICLKQPSEPIVDLIDGVHVYRLPLRHQRHSVIRYLLEYGLSFSLMTFIVTILYFRRHYSCIQVNNLPDALVFATVIPRLFGAKVLLDMHEPTPEMWVTNYGERRQKILKIHLALERYAIKYADRVITVNETIRTRFIERGASAMKIEVIRNVPGDSLIEDSNPYLSALPKVYTLITHGTIERRYGHEVILYALPLLRKTIERLQVYIVGDGEDLERLTTLSRELECSDIVSFIGYLPFPELSKLISKADVGLIPILPTPFGELCQPNKLFDYVALKRPVVISRLKAIQESFDDSCLMFFEPENYEDMAYKIIDIYNQPEKAKILVDNAYLRYDKMRWDKIKQIYLGIVANLNGNMRPV